MLLAGELVGGVEFAEFAEDLVVFEVEAFDWVVGAATLDGGPLDDAGGGCAERVAEIGLLIHLFGTRTSLAIGDKLLGGEVGVPGLVDDIEQAEFDGVGHGDPEIQIPGAARIFEF